MTAVTSTLDFHIRRNKLPESLESSCRPSNICMITVLSTGILNSRTLCLRTNRTMRKSRLLTVSKLQIHKDEQILGSVADQCSSHTVGLSKKFLNNQIGVMHEGVGTLYSMSPQVLQGVYTSQADLWSCGVITYMLLSSHRPFYHKRRKVMIDRIMRVDYTFEKDYWKPISQEAKDYIAKLLVMDPKRRMDAGMALKDTWLSKEFPLSDRVPDQSTADAVQGNLVLYKDTSQLKKIALNVSTSLRNWDSKVSCCQHVISAGYCPQVEYGRNHGPSKSL